MDSKGQKAIVLFSDASLNGMFSTRPLQWDLWAFRLSVNRLLVYYVFLQPQPVTRGQVPQRSRLLLLSPQWFNLSSANTPMSVLFSSNRLTKYRQPSGFHPLSVQVPFIPEAEIFSPEVARRFSQFPTLPQERLSVLYKHALKHFS